MTQSKKQASKSLKCLICGEMGYLVHENRKKYRRTQKYQQGKLVTTKYSTNRKRNVIYRIIHKDNIHCYLGVIGGKHSHILSLIINQYRAIAEYEKVLREGARFTENRPSN